MIESATLISTSAGIEQRRDATRALTEGPDQEGRTVIRSPGSRRMTWDGKKAINPGGLGACVREDLMDLLFERKQLG